MNGRQQIAAYKARLDAVFERGSESGRVSDLETSADFAKYLCVLVSGYLEKSIAEILLQHTRRNGSPTLQRFVESNIRNFTNVKCEKLKMLLGSFNPVWRDSCDALLVDETKDALDSLVANRHLIAHGGSVGITYNRVETYYHHVQIVISKIVDLCDPL